MYHISDIKLFRKCPVSYYINKTKKESFFIFFRNDYNLIDIYKNIFCFKDCFIGKKGDDPSLILDNLNNYEYFVNGRFSLGELRLKVSLLHKKSDGYSLYLFKPIVPKELDLDSLFIIFDVLRKNNILVNKIYLISANKDYVLEDEIDFKKALIISDKFNDNHIIDLVKNQKFDYENVISSIKNNTFNDKVNQISRICSSCDNFSYCFDNILDDDSIMHLVSSKYKYDMYCEGINKLKDVDLNRIDGTSLQYAQIMASKNGGIFIDKNRLSTFINSFKSDIISFIDFEWDSYLFPRYKNMKCFGLLPFEFSLYVKNNDKLDNYCYVGKEDCRKEFIEKLIEHIPNEGPIIAYNSFSAEVLRLEELSLQFPEFKDKLKQIANRFIDIAEVFSKGMIYDIRFKGQLSLKKVDSVISNISYNDLMVKDGLDAIIFHRIFEQSNDENIKKELVKYCNQDAYSLFVIYKYILNLI